MMKLLLASLVLLNLLLPQVSGAARLFDGTNDDLQSASVLDVNNSTGRKYAISWWLYWDTFANDSKLAMEYGATAPGDQTHNRFTIQPNATSGNFRFLLSGAAGLTQEVAPARPSAGAWHHFVMNVDLSLASNSIVNVFIDDAIPGTLNRAGAGNFISDNMADETLNIMSRNNASNFGAGQMASWAFYSGINLAQGDVDSLFAGTAPTSVQSGSLLYYWKLCGTDSPELPTTGAVNLTVNGGAGGSSHPSTISAECTATPMQSSGGFLGTIIK